MFTLIPCEIQICVEEIVKQALELAALSDMDGVLTAAPYHYSKPILDPKIVGPLARLNAEVGPRGAPLLQLGVVSARDPEAQLAAKGMPRGLFHGGGLGTRYVDPVTGEIIYVGDPAAAELCTTKILPLLVSKLITAGCDRYTNVYWDYRVDGINLILERLSKKRQKEVVTICQRIAEFLGLGIPQMGVEIPGSVINLYYRLEGREPNCDFLSRRMEEVGKGSALAGFLRDFPRVGFLLLLEDTKRWLETFVKTAQAFVAQGSSNLKGYCAVLVEPTVSGQDIKVEQVAETQWFITVKDQIVLAQFLAQYETMIRRATAACL